MNRFIVVLDDLLRDMQLQGRTGTQDTYLATYRSVFNFSGKRAITVEEVFTKDFLHAYQNYLIGKGCCYNTISSYMRVLRAIRNKAERRGIVQTDPDLFEKLYTGSEPTRKRAMSGDAILKMNDADLTDYPHLAISRDMFMLSFHLQGMSFIDLAHLRKADFKDGYITYRRRKTGSLVNVEVLPPAIEILNHYHSTDKQSPYLLSLIRNNTEDATTQYRSLLRKFNRHLKTLAEILEIKENLTSYVARHSWATAAYHIGVPTTIISEAMGHKTEEVTRIYLAAFNTETLAYANRLIWEALIEGKTTNRWGEKMKEKTKKQWKKNVSLLGRERHESAAKLKRTKQIRKHYVS